jgi:hypothetical protein
VNIHAGLGSRVLVNAIILLLWIHRSAAMAAGPESTNSAPVRAFVHIPREYQRFSTWQKLNPIWWIGNADDPVPPKSYRPGKRRRKLTWSLRNPFHNFTFYVIGIEDKAFLRRGRYADRVENPNGGWNWAVCHYRWLRLPFVDYHRGRFEFYFGWRNGGNFGMKLNFGQKKASPSPVR